MTSFKEHYISYIRDVMGLELEGDVQFQVDKRVREIEDLLTKNGIEERDLYQISDELKESVISISTNNETAFFRDKLLFTFLEELFQNRERSSILEILSFPCSTGQEPYSLAILLERLGYKGSDFFITCCDIDSKAIAKAREGVYSRFEMMRGLDESDTKRYFDKLDNCYQFKSSFSSSLKFQQANLLNYKSDKKFDLILLRNVLFYFDRDLQVKVLTSLSRSLRSGGVLVLGGGERISCDSLKLCEYKGMTYLKKLI